ncbi:MAG: hypothetical protein AAGJ82_13430 [Bacteroidota bacterium]
MKHPSSFSQPNTSPTEAACPNCWGIQQYEGQYQKPKIAWFKKGNWIERARNGFIRCFALRHMLR